MNLTFVDQIRLYRTPDGAVWGEGWGGYKFFQCYLSIFDRVRVICRVFPRQDVDRSFVRCDGPGVEFVSPPLFSGPWQYLRHRSRLKEQFAAMYESKSAYLLRVPSQLSFDLAAMLKQRRHPFGMLVVANPNGDFGRRATKSLLRPYLRYRFDATLRHLCLEAAVCAYVTRNALQREYPSPSPHRIDGASDVWLGPEWFVSRSRTVSRPLSQVAAVSVGSLANMVKGIDTLIEALAILHASGFPIRVLHAGEGQHRNELAELARRRGVSAMIKFPGAVPYGKCLLDILDHADLFLLPSRSEGLPRSLVEAMSRGLPAIGACVGGVPELLGREDMFSPDDPEALAAKIREVSLDPARLSAMSARNLTVARGFAEEKLAGRFRHVLHSLRTATEEAVK